MPTGYSFNLDGSTLYLAMASVFVAQAAETTMVAHVVRPTNHNDVDVDDHFERSSRRAAGITCHSCWRHCKFSFLPAGLGPIGVAIIFGVDELMDMGRTCVNVIGNCLATVVVARWEGEFDDRRARVFGTPGRS